MENILLNHNLLIITQYHSASIKQKTTKTYANYFNYAKQRTINSYTRH